MPGLQIVSLSKWNIHMQMDLLIRGLSLQYQPFSVLPAFPHSPPISFLQTVCAAAPLMGNKAQMLCWSRPPSVYMGCLSCMEPWPSLCPFHIFPLTPHSKLLPCETNSDLFFLTGRIHHSFFMQGKKKKKISPRILSFALFNLRFV